VIDKVHKLNLLKENTIGVRLFAKGIPLGVEKNKKMKIPQLYRSWIIILISCLIFLSWNNRLDNQTPMEFIAVY